MKIPLLDGKTILLAIDQVITPKTVKKIDGEGMKIFDKSDYMDKNVKRGDLYVQFEIDFPKMLNDQQRKKIAAILNN
jgi:DnaJ-class molecular chaperone